MLSQHFVFIVKGLIHHRKLLTSPRPENRKQVSFLFVTSAHRTVSGTQVIIKFLSLLNGWAGFLYYWMFGALWPILQLLYSKSDVLQLSSGKNKRGKNNGV